MPPSTVASIPGVRVPSAPSVTLQSYVRLPATVDLALLDDWLTTGLEVPVEPMPDGHGEADPQAAILWRGLLLAREFLQLAKVPAFDLPQILGLERKPGAEDVWKVTVSLPRVDQILNNAYVLAFNAGVDVCSQVCRLPRTPETVAKVYTAIVPKVIDPLRRMVVAGESGMHLLREARRLDIPFFHLGSDVFQLGWGRRRRLIDRSSLVGDSALGSRLVRNKYLAASFIRQAGLPAPEHELVGRIEEARAAAARIGHPLVVKPTDRERGEGVTTGVRSDADLAAALTVAIGATASRQALVEREVPGVCHRLFMARGRLLYAVKRLPHSIEGDGRRTVAELVVAANAREAARPPWRREKHYPLDTLALQVLAARGLGPSSVPAAGVFVPLRPIETTAWGGHDEEVTATIHPENVRVARRAAELFALDVAGVDIISPDITRPWYENGAIINEVNFAPLLGGHEISRGYIASYLRDLVEEDGRIPVEVFVGGAEAFAAARSRHTELVSRGTAAFLTSHDTTFDATGRSLAVAAHGLARRCRALFLDPAVGGLVLVAQTDELVRSGLPFDRITALHVVDRQLVRHDQPGAAAEDDDVAGVIERLRSCLVDADASGHAAKR